MIFVDWVRSRIRPLRALIAIACVLFSIIVYMGAVGPFLMLCLFCLFFVFFLYTCMVVPAREGCATHVVGILDVVGIYIEFVGKGFWFVG